MSEVMVQFKNLYCTQLNHRILRTILLIYGKTIAIMRYTVHIGRNRDLHPF